MELPRLEARVGGVVSDPLDEARPRVARVVFAERSQGSGVYSYLTDMDVRRGDYALVATRSGYPERELRDERLGGWVKLVRVVKVLDEDPRAEAWLLGLVSRETLGPRP